MLISVKQILGSSIQGTDGSVGSTKDLYFDGEAWDVRYIIVDTGVWLPGKKVLLNPADVEDADWGEKQFFVRQTKDEVKNAPHIAEDEPVSRQMEQDLAAYYGWPTYWEGGLPMKAPAPAMPEYPSAVVGNAGRQGRDGQSHLRSFREVKGYRIAATDEDIGQVADFIIDDEEWKVRYLVVDTGTWLPGLSVLLSPQWVDEIKWSERSVVASVSQEAVRSSPEFHRHEPVNRQYELQLYDYYGRKNGSR